MDTILMFRFARLYNFYTNPFIVILQFIVLLMVIGGLIFAIGQGVSVRFPIGLVMLFLMIELFMKMKLMSLKPEKKVTDVNIVDNSVKSEDVLKSFTLPAAALMLQQGNAQSFIKKLAKKKEVQFVLRRANIDINEIPNEKLEAATLITQAFLLAQEEQKPYVTTLDLFAAQILLCEKNTKLLFKKELKREEFLTIISWAQSVFPNELIITLPKVTLWGGGIGDDWVTGWTLETKKYTQDFTRKSLANPPIWVGREKELNLLIEGLLKSKRSNVLLVGPSGVGKSEVAAKFAIESFLGNLPSGLRFMRVLELLSGSLVAGATNSGELEKRLHNLIAEVAHSGDIVLYIPELQNIAGAGSDNLDVTGVLLPHLLGDKIHVIATISSENYKVYLEKRSEFVDAFEKINFEEPSREEAIPMLLDAAILMEKKHAVTFTYESVVAAVELSDKFMPDKFLPGKAVGILDEVAAKARLSGKPVIEKEDIVGLLESKLPVKISKPNKQEKELLLNLEDKLHQRVIDQKEAVKVVSEAMRRLRSGLSMGKRPVGVFLFLGPTGVGKTETARALAEHYFGHEEAMIRFDMSEYQAAGSSDRLIDALTDKVRSHPFSLLLLDEFEKAYFSILDLFLSVFEDGRLTDTKGRIVAFNSTIIIATSNAGAQVIREGIQRKVDLPTLKPELMDWLQKEGLFKPELINRFDAVVLFEPLGQKEVEQVSELLLKSLVGVLAKKDITFTFDKKATAKVAKEGFDPTMGARPLRRFIQDHVEDLLSKKLLQDEIKRGDTVILSTDAAGNLTLDVKES